MKKLKQQQQQHHNKIIKNLTFAAMLAPKNVTSSGCFRYSG